MDKFILGHYYYNANDVGESPITFKCRKSIFFGLQLTSLSGIFHRSISCTDPNVQAGNWVDCTEQVKRSEAMRNCTECQLVPITRDMIGTIIAFPEGRNMSAPHFLYAYDRQMAYLMTLDGADRVFNQRLTHCYPLQRMYTDITTRAMSPDPLQSSVFDRLFKWLKTTPQYGKFLSAAQLVPLEDREDMVKLFELMSFDGVTAETFEAKVRAIYDTIPVEEKEGVAVYTAVLEHYKSPSRAYTKIEQEIMRATNFKYKSPKEAWEAVGGGKPYPKTLQEAIIMPPRAPELVVADTVGLYETPVGDFWFSEVCMKLGTFYDFETEWEKGLAAYMEKFPDFDEQQLSFIKEEDKAAVFRKYLGVTALDPKDPYRAWIKDPPIVLREAVKEDPQLSYVQAFKNLYFEEAH